MLFISTVIDIKYKVIYDGITLLGCLIILHYQFLQGDIKQCLLGIDTGILIVWIMNLVKLNRLGGGDTKLMALVGAALGWKAIIVIAPLAWLICKVCRIWNKEKSIAYAPFISTATLMVVLCPSGILY